jgi:hypothetical protein
MSERWSALNVNAARGSLDEGNTGFRAATRERSVSLNLSQESVHLGGTLLRIAADVLWTEHEIGFLTPSWLEEQIQKAHTLSVKAGRTSSRHYAKERAL